MDNRKFIGVSEAAEMLNRSESAVRQMVWRKQVPHRKVAHRIVFVRSELDSPGVRPEEVERVTA
jgi:hypothetical protein